MNRAHADNALLAAASAAPGMLAKMCAAFIAGMAISGVLYLCYASRTGGL